MPGTLNVDNINANMRNCKYDVRGEIYHAAVKRSREKKSSRNEMRDNFDNNFTQEQVHSDDVVPENTNNNNTNACLFAGKTRPIELLKYPEISTFLAQTAADTGKCPRPKKEGTR